MKKISLIPRRNPRALARVMNAIVLFLLGRKPRALVRGASLIFVCFIFINRVAFCETKVKLPNVSGQFYPSDKNSLSSQIDSFFKDAKQDPEFKNKDILAIISPHAGYVYSGQVAAYGFKAIQGREFDTVIVIAPSHFHSFEGFSVYKEGYFRTPLGDIEVDEKLAEKIISYNEKIKFISEAFEKEHSLEVELPFLQKSLGNFKIVPIVVGQVDYTDAVMLARLIAEISKTKKILLVASTDLSHYHPYLKAAELDAKTISYIKNLDPLGLWQANRKGEPGLCGLMPVVVLLNYAKELGASVKVLKYANSGDVTGDKSGVVGYASVVFFKDSNPILNYYGGEDSINKVQNSNLEGEKSMFTKEQKRKLLEIARRTITEYVTNGKKPTFKEDDPQLNIKRGCFVTLHKNGDLRGCIGTFTSSEPLYETISKMAIESATEDPRFKPVSKEELDNIEIEISVLTEPELIGDWKKIRLGVDGVIIKKGFSQGVFLPQVATETGWDLETFLSQLCRQKAGLPADSYKNPSTQIYTFQAIIFSENDRSD